MHKSPSSTMGLPIAMPRRLPREETPRNVQLKLFMLFALMCCGFSLYQYYFWVGNIQQIKKGSHLNVLTSPTKRIIKRQNAKKNLLIDINNSSDQFYTLNTSISESKWKNVQQQQQIAILLTNTGDSSNCGRNLAQAIEYAKYPERLIVNLFEEIPTEDMTIESTSCLRIYCDLRPMDCEQMLKDRPKRLYNSVQNLSGYRGITMTKYFVEAIIDSEIVNDTDFYLSIDSSILFTKNWDVELLLQWYSVGNSKAILSHAPKAIEMQELNDTSILIQCLARISSSLKDPVVLFNEPEPMQYESTKKPRIPILQAQYSELFHFGQILAIKTVRSDPYTLHITDGHEYIRAARFWTHGYDFYAPTKDIFYANYGKNDIWYRKSSKTIQTQKEKSYRRIRQFLGLSTSVSSKYEPLEKEQEFGLGKNRTLQQYKKFSSIDPGAKFNPSTRNQFVACHQNLHYIRYQ